VPNIIKIPVDVFEDFRELNEENENLFEYVATEIVIHFIKFCIKGGP
jgi:hypothetical protein